MLENVRFKKTCLGKSEMCSGNKYRITLSNDNGTIWFVFHDNFHNNSSEREIIECLISDAEAYENCYNLADFQNEFGYENDKEAERVYYACKKQSERLHKLLGY